MLLLAFACTTDPQPTAVAPLPAMGTPAIAQDGDGVVASWEGGQLTYDELQGELGNELVLLEVEYLQNRYQVESSALHEVTMLKVLETEAASRSMSLEELLKVEVEDQVAQPTEDEVKEYYPVVARQLRGAPFDSVKDQVEIALLNRRQGERMQVYLEQITAKYTIEKSLPYPDLPRLDVSEDDDPSRGPDDAPVTIVEFADYNCGYCRKIYPTLVELLEEDYEGKVRLVYRDYPLSGGNGGLEPTVAANCADQQGKYWEMHDALMRKGNYSETALLAYAAEIGLEAEAFQACAANVDAALPEIMNDFQHGREVGVSGTPAFFVNGIPLSGAVPKEQFVAVIEKELKKGT